MNPASGVGGTETSSDTEGLGLLVFASLVGFAVSTGLFVFEDVGFGVATAVGTKDCNPMLLGMMVE